MVDTYNVYTIEDHFRQVGIFTRKVPITLKRIASTSIIQFKHGLTKIEASNCRDSPVSDKGGHELLYLFLRHGVVHVWGIYVRDTVEKVRVNC